jgi:exodeoxyribonuclease-3
MAHPRLVLLGDFNIAPEDRDVHDPQAWQGSGARERAGTHGAQGVARDRPGDCFRLFEQPEKTYSWWDYRMLAFRRNHGLRIDLIPRERGDDAKMCRVSHRQGAAQARKAF